MLLGNKSLVSGRNNGIVRAHRHLPCLCPACLVGCKWQLVLKSFYFYMIYKIVIILNDYLHYRCYCQKSATIGEKQTPPDKQMAQEWWWYNAIRFLFHNSQGIYIHATWQLVVKSGKFTPGGEIFLKSPVLEKLWRATKYCFSYSPLMGITTLCPRPLSLAADTLSTGRTLATHL